MKPGLWALRGAVLSLLLGCGSDRVAGGGSSESGNAIVLGRVVDSSGAAVAGARVLAVDQEKWLQRVLEGRGVALDSFRTDGQGRFTLRIPKGSRFNLEVVGPGVGRLERDAQAWAAGAGRAAVLTALPLGRAAGAVSVRGGAVSALRLPGTSFSATLRPDGAYAFAGLPQGRYGTLALLGTESDSGATTGASFRVDPGVETVHDLDLDREVVLLEDFGVTWPRSRLSELTGWGNWHEVRDTGHPGQKSRLEHALVEGPESFAGASLRMQAMLDSSYAGVGLHLGVSAGYDLSSLRALRFQGKGRGRLRVSVESVLLDSLGEDQFEAYVDLPADWSALSIPAESLRLPPGSEAERRGITWQAASRQIVRIEFLFLRPSTAPGDTGLLWLDDLALEGAPLEAFLP